MQNTARTPLVELLRLIPRETWVEIVEPSGWSYHTNIGNLLHQAADEIDYLQNNAQQRVQWTAGLVAQVKSLLSSLWSAVLRRH